MNNGNPSVALETLPGAVQGGASALRENLRLAYAALWPIPAFAALYFIISRLLWAFVPHHVPYSIPLAFLSALMFLFAYGVIFIFRRIWVYIRHENPKSPTLQLARDLKEVFANRAALLNFAVIYPAFILFMFTFTELKGNIPLINPYGWDATFAHLDKALFAGHDPWRLLEPLLGNAYVTFIINFVYNFWFFLFLGSLISVAISRTITQADVRYLLSFMLAWSIGGSLLATLFSSAGPAFYGRLGLSPDVYAPLMNKLHAFNQVLPVWALEKQDALWSLFEMKRVELGGMSAFPSMHNAQATLMALYAWKLGRKLGWAATIYAGFIMTGSVWLGWHYAVDAMAGIAIAWGLWMLSGPLAAAIMKRPAMRRYRAVLRALARA